MKTLVTGSSGHLGEALVTVLRDAGETVVGVDVREGPCTDRVASVDDAEAVTGLVAGMDAVIHAATLHKPHVVTHTRRQFVDTNITGTLTLLDAAVEADVGSFVFVSTTSMFGHAMRPGPEAPAVWVTEDLQPAPRNIYGVTKTAAEDLCELTHRRTGLPVLVLRTSRFFPEIDDDEARRAALGDGNLKTVEFLYRRVDIEDVVSAALCARARAPELGFDRFIVSATSPFEREDLAALRSHAQEVLARRLPASTAQLEALSWSMIPSVDRVYDNRRARDVLGWTPRHDFTSTLERAVATGDWRSPLALRIGSKGYHDRTFDDGPFPVDDA